ncbi:MAG: autotransporter-associated beta strand repeat-containing protein, partial [Planctomycetota bacterium]
AVTVNGALNFASGGGTETIGSLAGSGTVSSVVSGTYSLAVGGSTNTTFSGVINNGSGVVGLTKSGAGTLTLTGSNGFTGGSSLNAGTLGVGSANALGSSGTISFGGGTLQYSASNTTDYSGRFSNAAGQQYSIDTNGQNVTLGSNLTSSGGSFTKLGAGNLILSGSSTYSGATTVSAGRLSVNGSLGTTAVTVQSGAEVGGSGSIGGVVNVLAGGTLSPGNSIQSLAVAATTFSGSSTFEYEYDSTNPASLAAAADLLVVNGNLAINSGAILTLTDLASSPRPFVNNTTIFALINYSGTWNGGLFTYNGTELADGAWFLVSSQEWEIDYNRTSSTGLDNFTGDYLTGGSFVVITAVPEPATLALVAVGMVLAPYAMRRRRRCVRGNARD